MGGFCYRFWSSDSPKLEKKKIPKKKCAKKVAKALTNKNLEKLNQKLEAIERYINLAAIMVGILQYLSIKFTKEVWKVHRQSSWLRSYSSEIPSEETVRRTFQATWIFNSRHRSFSWAKQIVYKCNQEHINRSIIPEIDTLNSE